MHQHIPYNSTRGQKEPQHTAHLFHTIHSLVFIRYPLLSWLCVFFETKRSKLIMWLIGDSLWKKDKGNNFSPWLYIDTSLFVLKLLIKSRKVSFFSSNITFEYVNSRSGNTMCVCVCVPKICNVPSIMSKTWRRLNIKDCVNMPLLISYWFRLICWLLI